MNIERANELNEGVGFALIRWVRLLVLLGCSFPLLWNLTLALSNSNLLLFPQESLLLSILPAHISMGMKLAIIERLKETNDMKKHDNNFHSLYVKRHQNVR